MLRDEDLILSDDQALTASAASTNAITLTETGISGDGAYEEDLFLNFLVTTELDSGGGTATLTISLQADSAAAFSSAATLLASEAIAESSLEAGYKRSWNLKGLKLEEFNRAYFTVASENFTSGAIQCWVGREPFASNVN